jgi:hypothetical protein
MTPSRPSDRYIDHRARAELLGSVGAGVLGAGLAVVFKDALEMLAVPLLVLGGAMHVLGMYQKHHLDATKMAAGPSWTAWAYWTCWLLLLGLGGYVWWSRATL